MVCSFPLRQARAILLIACALVLFVSPSFAAGLANAPSQGSAPELTLGADPQRSSPVPLEGQVLAGDAYIFASSTPEIADVFFFLDVPVESGLVFQHEGHAPYDFAGTASGGVCREFDTTTLSDGPHRIEALVLFDDGSRAELGADFVVQNSGVGQLLFTPFGIDLALEGGQATTASATLSTTTNETIDFNLLESADWLSLGMTGGTTPAQIDLAVDSAGLAPGTYTTTVVASADGRPDVSLTIELEVQAAAGDLVLTPATIALQLAPGETGSASFDLATTMDGNVAFTLTESTPWLTLDLLAGTTPASIGATMDSTGLEDGAYQATVEAASPGRPSVTLVIDLVVQSPPPTLVFMPGNVEIQLAGDSLGAATVQVETSTGAAVLFSLAESVDWLELSASVGTTPASFDLLFDSTGLEDGVYQASVEAASAGLDPGFLSVELVVGDPTACAPLPCQDILVDLPFLAEFRVDEGGIVDQFGVGTGFTALDAPDGTESYQPELLALDLSAGVLELTTTRGIHFRSVNNQANTIGVGFDASAGTSIVRTTLVEPTAGTGSFEQAGLWIGTDNDNFLKFVVASTRNGSVIQALLEVNGQPVGQTSTPPIDLTQMDVSLEIELDPQMEFLTCYASLNGSPPTALAQFAPPASFFNLDPAAVDPAIGTSSFAGVFGTHRHGPEPVVWSFRGFQIDVGGGTGEPALAFSEEEVALEIGPAAQASLDVTLDVTSGSPVDYTLEEFEPWLELSALGGMTPEVVTLTIDSSSLADGVYEGSVTAVAPGLPTATLPVVMTVASPVGELSFTPDALALELAPGEIGTYSVALSTTGGGATTFALTGGASWLSLNQLAGSTPASLEITADAAGLADGVYQATLLATSPDAPDLTLGVELIVATPPGQFALTPPSVDFLLGALAQDAATVNVTATTGEAVAFSVSENEDWLTLTTDAGVTPASFDVTVDTSGLANGVYIAQVLVSRDGSATEPGFVDQTLTVQMTVDAPPAELVFMPGAIEFALEEGEIGMAMTMLSTTSGEVATYELAEETPWLEISAPMGATPIDVGVTVDATGLDTGVYQAVVTATADDFSPVNLAVQLTVGDPNACLPLPCEEILVDLPYVLTFTQDHGGIVDSGDVGTGFTTIEAPNGSDSYRPDLLVVNAADAVLELTTTKGLHHRSDNSQINTLGVGIDAPNQVAIVRTTLIEPNGGTGRFEQGGLWFGIDNDNFVKFVVASTRSGSILHGVMEVDGIPMATTSDVPRDFTGTDVELELVIDPENERVTGFATVGTEARREIIRFSPPAAFFSFDAAGINPAIGTRSFVGVFGSHRNGPAALVYRFRGFSIEKGETVDSGGGLAFDRTEIPAEDPTNLVWGPDDRLYVTSLLGGIEAMTLDPLNNVVDTEVINTLTDALGNRLTLGIAVGPESTSSNVVLYVAHSNASLSNGQIDSAMVSRISGPGFGDIEHVVTGLPRATANHSINSIHFGPDGRLYIAVGSNTGSGATNTAQTEFGFRPEQPLSAAVLVADLSAPGFDGTCQNVTNPFGVPPCSVTPWATGVRNMYDFVFHSNGNVYGPDNGLGAIGTFPPSAVAPCFADGDISPASQGGQNPGTQSDSLFLLVEGGYYGHPNPAREECVFGDGSLQGVPALPNYRAPLFNLGDHRSANGITEYPFDVGCVPLGGDLLVANYSVGDNITRIVLSPDGQTVVADETLVGGFVNPIALTTNPAGTIFVAELGADQVTALIPRSLGCWLPLAPLPVGVAQMASALLGGDLFVAGGRTDAGLTSEVFSYDEAANAWTGRAALPGPALEGAAGCELGGQMYVLGGASSTDGAVATAYALDPATDTWTALAPMGTPRAFATATAVLGKIYVVGGITDTGASTATAEVFDPVTGQWSVLAPMAAGRDSAVAFAVGGELFVAGGRRLAAGGQVLSEALSTLESYNPATDTWTPRAAMPTARHSALVGSLEGRYQLAGGIDPSTSTEALAVTEEYDPGTDSWRTLATLPVGRFGAAAVTIGARVFAAGGSDGTTASAELLSFEF